jgi:hypothetical protein
MYARLLRQQTRGQPPNLRFFTVLVSQLRAGAPVGGHSDAAITFGCEVPHFTEKRGHNAIGAAESPFLHE